MIPPRHIEDPVDTCHTIKARSAFPGALTRTAGTVSPTGKRMDAPCCDGFRVENGKIQSFNCYPSGTIILARLGVFPTQPVIDVPAH